MALTAINPRYFNTTFTISRRATTVTSTGDLSQTWTVLNAAVPATIQAQNRNSARGFASGEDRIYADKGYDINMLYVAYLPTDVLAVLNGDRVTDNDTGLVLDVINVELTRISRADVTPKKHHYKLSLLIPKDLKS